MPPFFMANYCRIQKREEPSLVWHKSYSQRPFTLYVVWLIWQYIQSIASLTYGYALLGLQYKTDITFGTTTQRHARLELRLQKNLVLLLQKNMYYCYRKTCTTATNKSVLLKKDTISRCAKLSLHMLTPIMMIEPPAKA